MDDAAVRRRKVIAFVLSGIFPGLGQFYNRDLVKGALFLGVSIVLSWLMGRALPTDLLTPPPFGTSLLVPSVLLLAIWIWSVIDAWRSAHA
jgi:hypothetical protein